MAEFNKNAFMKKQYEPRAANIDVPVLAEFFGDSKPVWIVRGQTANEIAKGHEATANNRNIANILAAVGNDKEKIDELKQAMGISDDTPDDIIKRLGQFVTCSVSPEIDKQFALKLAETFPVEFYLITNKIVELTGLGMDEKKPKASGETQK